MKILPSYINLTFLVFFCLALVGCEGESRVPQPDAIVNITQPTSPVYSTEVVTLHADITGEDSILWIQTSGASVTLSNETTENPVFTAPVVASRQTLTFELQVKSGTKTSTFPVSLDVIPGTLAVNAGKDQLVNEGASVSLSASASSTPTTTVSYAWVQLSGYTVSIINANTANPTFIATVPYQKPTGTSLGFFDGNLIFQVTITESGTLRTTTDEVTIHVQPPLPATSQTPLSLKAGLDQVVKINHIVHLHAVAQGGLTSSAGAGGYSYNWVKTSEPSGSSTTLNLATSANPNFTPSTDGRYVFTVTVTDDNSTTETDSVTIDVFSGLQIKLKGDRSVIAGSNEQLESVVTGGFGIHTYEWQADKAISYTTGSNTDANPTISYDPTTTETVTMILTVTDSSVSPALVVSAQEKITFTVPVIVNLTPTPSPVHSADVVHLHADITYADSILWIQTSGASTTLVDATTENPVFTAPVVASRETLTFELQVKSGTQTSTSPVSLDVIPGDLAVNAGNDKVVNEGDTVSLSASAKSTPATTVSYAWVQLSGSSVSITDADTANPTFIATVPYLSPTATSLGTFDGTLVFEVTITESGTSRTTTDEVTIHVQQPIQQTSLAPQTPLSVTAGLDQLKKNNHLVHLHAIAQGGLTSVAGASGYNYNWVKTSEPSGSSITLNNATSANPDFTPITDGRYIFTVTVSDDNSTTKTDSVIIDVFSGLQINLKGDRSVKAGQKVSLHSVITGGFGTHTYEWQADKPISYITGSKTDANPIISYNPASTETVTMTLQVTDSSVSPALVASAQEKITFIVPPRVTSVDAGVDKTVQSGDRVSLHALATPTTGVAYRWQAPTGVTLLSDTSANPVFTAPSVEGSYTFTVTASTVANSVTDTVTITVQTPLTTNAGVDHVVTEGHAIYLHGAGAHGSGTYTYLWSVLTPVAGGGTFDDDSIANAKFNPAKAGLEYTLQLSVTDSGTGTTETDTVKMTVLAKLTVDAGTDRTVAPSAAVTLHATTNVPGASFQWDETAPATGIAINNDTTDNADFTAPTLESLYTFDVTAQKAFTVAQAKDDVNIMVQAPLTTNAGADLTITQGHTAALHGSATHGSAPYTYLWSIVTEPSVGAGAFDDNTLASPTFTPSKAGAYKLDFKATDSTTPTAQSIHDTLTIAVNPSLQVDAGTAQTTTAGKTLALRPTISGGIGPFTYAWTLPAGVTLTTGTNSVQDIDVSYTPTATESKTLSLVVTDIGDGNQVVNDTVDLTWTVTAVPAGPPGTVPVTDPVVAAAIATPCDPGQHRQFLNGKPTARCLPNGTDEVSYPITTACPSSARDTQRTIPAGAVFNAIGCGTPDVFMPPAALCEKASNLAPPKTCKPGELPFVRLNNKKDGTRTWEMGCMSIARCSTEFADATLRSDKCKQFSMNNMNRLDFSCTWCCVGDGCNLPDAEKSSCPYQPETLGKFF